MFRNVKKYEDLKGKYRILQRKYHQLDSFYREAKAQLSTLKDEFATSTQKWREWHENDVQKRHFRIETTSPTKKQHESVNIDEPPEQIDRRNEDRVEVVDEDVPLDQRSLASVSSDKDESTASLNSLFKSCSTRTSEPKKKKRGYPNMKYFTEDGTDGINPQPDSQIDEDDGVIATLLAGPPPQPLGKATPVPKMLPPAPSTPVSKIEPNSKGRAREIIELDSDSVSSSSGNDVKRQKMEQARSEPRARRPIFSPGHAEKKKGKGRYSESFSLRYNLFFSVSDLEMLGIHFELRISPSIRQITKEYRMHSMMWSEIKKPAGVCLQPSVQIAQR